MAAGALSWGPHEDWARRAEADVRAALSLADPDIAAALKRHPEAVISSESPAWKVLGWKLEPRWSTVAVLTEYGIGDPMTYPHVFDAFTTAATKLDEFARQGGTDDHRWGWDSYNPAIQYFYLYEPYAIPTHNPASLLTGPRWDTARAKLASAAATAQHGKRKRNPPRVVRMQEVIASVVKSPTTTRRVLMSPDDAVVTMREMIGSRANEVFFVMYVNIRNQVVGYVEMTEGNPIGVSVAPYGIFREAMLVNGAAFVTAHQHPTGDPSPSEDDQRLWDRLREAGKIMGIPCLDNFVLGGTEWYSEMEGYSRPYPKESP